MMNPATQLFMLTPMAEWHYDELKKKDKDKTLLMHILECLVEGELEATGWEDILHCRPMAYTAEYFKEICYDVWDYDLGIIEDILGNCDIDWQAAAEERMKFMTLECEKLEDEAITRLAKDEVRKSKEWDSFKQDIDRRFVNPCALSIAETEQSVRYYSDEIKIYTKRLNYMKDKLQSIENK